MSTTIDNKVVEMRFDNKQFESNVQTSLSTIDKLKQSLNFDKSAKSLEAINSASKGINFSGFGNAIDTVHAKFSALEVMGVTALANITNSAVNAGKRIASALTIEPIKTGFQEYETQINAVQTILANTQSKGTTLKEVNNALDELNTYADKTIYNFTEMTRNIGTFTAAGIDLNTSVNAIQGIANLAAVSGSTSQQASTAMYQLSQALASGTVKLMDWNSVVNAGMGGQVFQDALKKTSELLGTGAEDAIKAEGSFRESLKTGWLTSEVLTETLKKFTTSGANEYVAEYTGLSEEAVEASLKEAKAKYGEADAIKYASKALAEKSGKNEDEIKSALELAKTSEEAATKVKTFTQLWDTLKEAAQSGWTQSWEIIVGDFEEAKSLLTEISDTMGAIIGKSADARNEMLQGWKDIGGRTALIDAFRNAFEGIGSIITPIKEAFREIFPPITSKQLYNLTVGLRDLTAKLKISGETADKIKSVFKGVFSTLDIGLEFIKSVGKGISSLLKNFSGLSDSVLDSAASFGDWLSNLRDTIKETDIFGQGINKVIGFLSKIITKLKEFGSSLKDSIDTPTFDGFFGFFEALFSIITSIGSKVGEAFGSIGRIISDAIGKGDIFEVLSSGLFVAILNGIRKFIANLADSVDNVGGFLENITGILDDVRDCFKAYQDQLKAGTLLKIATAIGILAAAIFVISTIDDDSLAKALGAITVLFGELLGSLAIFTKISGDIRGVIKACSVMVTMSVAILILASALKVISTVDWNGIAKGLVAIGGLMFELSLFLRTAKFDGKLMGSVVGIVILSSAMLILAKAVKNFGSMNWSEIGKGLASIGALLAEIAIFSKLTSGTKNVLSTGVAMILIGASMKIFASAMKDFSGMKWDEIGKGLTAMGGALAEVAVATRLMPKNIVSMGVGLVIVGAALKIVASSLSDFGGMKWEEIGKGLAAMGGSLLILAVALRVMNGTLAGSAALIIAATALAILVPVMKSLGGMSWTEIAKGLIAIAGAFAIIGVAGLLLSPLVPTILGLAAAFALFGIATLGIGAGLSLIGIGLTAISIGFSALATSVSVGATAIVAGLTIIIVGLLDLIPTVAQKLGEGIVEFAIVIGEYTPQLAESFLKMLLSVLNALGTYAPQIVSSLATFLIGVIDSLSEHIPALITACMNFVSKLFQGIIDAINGMDFGSILKGIIAVALTTALIYALSGIAALVPGAMLGILGVGAVIAELALVLAAIGGLAQIQGLSWLIEEGGDFLQKIGTAIGQFIGGIAGGVMEGITANLPEVGINLSDFMSNLQPFIEGAKRIDESALAGVKSLVEVIAMISGASIIESVASWLTGGSSMETFASQLDAFGKAIVGFSNTVKGNVDESAVAAAANAGTLMATLQSKIVPTGGVVQWFTGNKDLGNFGKQIKKFGEAMVDFSKTVAGNIDAGAVIAAANAGKIMATVQKSIPENKWLDGKISLKTFGKHIVKFGEYIADFSDKVTGIDTSSVTTSVSVARQLANFTRSIAELDLSLLNNFKVKSLGSNLKDYSDKVTEVNYEAVTKSISSARKLLNFINSISSINTSGVSSFKNAVNSLSKTNMSGFVEAFSGSSSDLSSAGSSMMNSLLKGINSRRSSLTSTASSLVMNMYRVIVGRASMFSSAGVMLISRLEQGILSRRSFVISSVSSSINSAASIIRGHYSSFYSGGTYLGEGLVQGIKSKENAAYKAGYKLGQKAAQGEKDGQKSNSPSKLTIQAGKWLGEGLVIGINSMGNKAYNAGYELGDRTTKSISSAISKIPDLLNGDMDLQPSIVPVLDLSEVKSGVGAINGLLDTKPSVGVMANLNAISSSMNSRNQNGGFDDVVSSIDKLRKDLGNVKGNTYTINGITYDDGSNIADAVKVLTRAARIERRI